MSTESIEVSGIIHAPPERIYQAWLNSSEHSAMTGGQATVDPNIGGHFSIFDGYAEGSTIELEPGRRIVQRWRSTEFPSEAGDSLLEIRFEPLESGTRVAFLHSEIPEGQATKYEQGWREHYLEPMGRYFSTGSATASGPAPMEEPTMGEPEAVKPKPKPPAKKAAPRPAAKKAAPKKAAPARAAKKKSAKKSKKAAPRRSARKSAAKKKGKSRSSKKRSARRGKR